jgi:hypothetical protein
MKDKLGDCAQLAALGSDKSNFPILADEVL